MCKSRTLSSPEFSLSKGLPYQPLINDILAKKINQAS